MSRVRNRKEGQSFTLVVKLLDEDVELALPDTVRYRIDCLTNRRIVRDWTDITPATTLEILVTPDDNAILNQRNPEERRQMIIETNAGTDSQFVETSDWTVKNLQGLV